MTLLSRVLARLHDLPPAETHDIVVDRDLATPMPDGVTLLADRHHPRGAGKLPTVLVRSPYGRRGPWGLLFGRLFAERGFQVLIQSCRGTFGSGGVFAPFRNERRDGLATLAWLKDQPWFSGTFATLGPSYLGYVQWAVGADAAPALGAVSAQVTQSNFQRAFYDGGSFSLDTLLSWTHLVHHQERSMLHQIAALNGWAPALEQAMGHLPLREADVRATGAPAAFWRDWLAHDTPGDPWWQPVDHSDLVAGVAAPASFVGGWYDIFLPWMLEDYARLKRAGRSPHLLIGPWSHTAPGLMRAASREALGWMRAHLHGDRSLLREAPVRLHVMGADAWRDFPDWPPAGARSERWHLHAGGLLSQEPPSTSAPDRYRYDPASPTPAVGGVFMFDKKAGPKDNRALEARPDVLTYTSAPLPRDLTVIGPVRAELHVRSSLRHADFFARLCDVEPGGRSTNVCDALTRVSRGRPEPAADGTLPIGIDLWPTAYCFRRGHRLRLQVSSGAHPRYARNPGSGEPLATATTLLAADQEVHHDPAHPSAVVLSVMD